MSRTLHRPGIIMSAALLAGLACLAADTPGPAERPNTPAAGAGTTKPSRTPPIVYGRPRKLADLADRAVEESSGLACGRGNEGVFWTHNDSGDSPRLFAFDAQGHALATVAVAGAHASDWEDLCSATIGRRHLLLIADTGNNACLPRPGHIYVVAEPKLDLRKRRARVRVRCLQTIRFRFADGWFDCESIAVDPTSRRIYLTTKARSRGQACQVHELRWPKTPGDKTWTARPIATLKGVNAGAMDMSPDGHYAVVLSYTRAYTYVRQADETWSRAFERGGRRVTVPQLSQSEGICFGRDGKTLYVTSEGSPCPLWELPVEPAKPKP